jgi:xanthine dehydrogenase accessory factor
MISEQISILVLGLGPLASAAARLVFLAGNAVAMHQASDPKVLRRKMSFADAWSDGDAVLDGVEARVTGRADEFVAGMRQQNFIPVLTHRVASTVERWPWDIVLDAAGESGGAQDGKFNAPLRMGLGPGPVAGEDCDLVIATEGLDPGAVIRKGSAPADASRAEIGFHSSGLSLAPHDGRFRAVRDIGAMIGKGDLLGHVGATPIVAPRAGRLIGLRRPGAVVAREEKLAEVVLDPRTPFSDVGANEQAIARAVLLAAQMEVNGWEPVKLKGLV